VTLRTSAFCIYSFARVLFNPRNKLFISPYNTDRFAYITDVASVFPVRYARNLCTSFRQMSIFKAMDRQADTLEIMVEFCMRTLLKILHP
jgi:hypothetical protein